eukprot:6650750-Alexandrium_andersonii.AAC.1
MPPRGHWASPAPRSGSAAGAGARALRGFRLAAKTPGEKNPAGILAKAVNADLIDRRLQFVNLRWEDGQASCATRLDGFSWGMLRPNNGSP